MFFYNYLKKIIPFFVFFIMLLAIQSVMAVSDDAIDGTTGAPLGGIGCGAIKFCAYQGTFSGTFRTPCALDNFQAMANTQFQFFSKSGQSSPVTSTQLKAVQTGGRADDDAVYPVHYANFGTINGVSVMLSAFSPVNLTNVDLMCFPYALYQISVTNTGTASVDVAVAMQAGLTAATALASGKGIRNDDGALKRAVYASSDDPTAVISAGNDAGFLTTGQCNNAVSGATNKVAVKVTLAAGQSRLIKFVYAWYNNVTGFEGNHDGMFYYLNTFADAGAVADTGLAHFDQMRDNAVGLVTRMRASNFPAWIKNQALVTLANLTNNSMFRKDGRYAHTEGEWNTNGTMDQMFHARQIYSMLVPSLNWQELRYWARTQKTSPAGQVHHDIDSCTDIENLALSRNVAYMCPWDAQQHHDYQEIDKWVDLNCAFIISVYETFIATADTAQLNYFWPFVKKAGQRIMDQLAQLNDASEGFPYLYSGSQNSYDADGVTDISFYNSSLAAVTYKVMSNFASIKGDADKIKYDAYYDSTRFEFAKKYLKSTSSFPPIIRAEAAVTGPWLSYYLKLGEMFDTAGINIAIKCLTTSYSPLTQGLGPEGGTYTEWAEYKTAHFGGLCLQTGRQDIWRALQYDWYERIFNNRNLVYNIPLDIPAKVTTPTYLASSFSGFNQYISAPVIWRHYYSMVGYQRNKFTSELWLEPIIPQEMNHKMTNAVVFSPEGWATISASESGTNFTTQSMSFQPDTPIAVKSLYVFDKGLTKNYIRINMILVDDAQITKIGSGYAKELKINWEGTIPSTGLTITVSDDSTYLPVINHIDPELRRVPVFSASLNSFTITTCIASSHEIRAESLNGKTVKIARGFGKTKYRFSSSGQQGATCLAPGVYVVKVISGKDVFSKRFAISR
jgi:Predicted bile acid beta-glucosidase